MQGKKGRRTGNSDESHQATEKELFARHIQDRQAFDVGDRHRFSPIEGGTGQADWCVVSWGKGDVCLTGCRYAGKLGGQATSCDSGASRANLYTDGRAGVERQQGKDKMAPKLIGIDT